MAAKKALKEQQVSTGSPVKKAAPKVSNQRKVASKAKAPAKRAVRKKVIVPVEVGEVAGVAQAKTRSRAIMLLQRFKN